MAEPRIDGRLRVMNGTTDMRTLKEMNELLNKLTPVSLYDGGTTGSLGPITLTETAANFGLIDIIYSKRWDSSVSKNK